nr:hypothetical protein [Candidatus Sigynarchaeota archaeon]
MSIVLKREARQFLDTIKDDIDFVLIDGRLQVDDEKVCGCCGPPPSPDYKVQVFKKNDSPRVPITEKTIDLEKIVKFKVSKQLYEAIVAARMNIVLFYLESTNEQVAPSVLVAKFI